MILTANEMPCWYYDKKDLKNTPSIRDEIDYETERRYRREGARFIMQCGTDMGLGHNTIATGVVYFHRFYMFQSFHTFPRYVTACCCLFLAGKVEETPKKCKDIIKQAKTILSDQKFLSFGEDPKEEVMTLERILLQTIKFDLQVDHPYSFLVKYAKCLKGDQLKLEKMVQMAWNFVNDSLSTTVCLQWEPEIIAVALIHLASKLSKFTVIDWLGRQSNHFRWWDMFVADVTMPILEDICHQVLDLYQQSNVSSNIHNNNNTNNNANINSNNSNQTDGNESPPQLPPSKASPPIKRDNIPPVFKTSPQPQPIQIQIQQPPQTQQLTTASITQHQKQQQQVTVPSAYTQHNMSIDEKIETHEIQRLSMADNHMHYNYPPAPVHAQSFNSMYMHPSYSAGPSSLMPPNIGVQGQQSLQQTLHQPPTQSSAYQYNTMPPQPIMGHYQSTAPPPMHAIHGSHPPHQQNYYQQPPVRGSYYPPH